MKIKVQNREVVSLKMNNEKHALVLQNFELFSQSSIKCTVTMKSRGFAYDGDAYFDNVDLFTEDISSMAESMDGTATLKEDYGDHFIKFKVTKLGHVIVSGAFVEHSDNSQLLEFEFVTDQTCLEAFACELEDILGASSIQTLNGI